MNSINRHDQSTTIQQLSSHLSALVSRQMIIKISDHAEDAEQQPAPVIQREYVKWGLTEDGEHVRLYMDPHQFIAVPIAAGQVEWTVQEDGTHTLTAEDKRGKLQYEIRFVP
ncbi:hypothetical protein [Brevibacillus dissolubilis]|uniref:hypothetical protein n=1 Tax=Brevibacillus dissolubilis TaxID=1844116 RepID=UPI0011164ECF|nr:hypothetical protein [Brevibacillus dissolubilis]